MIDKLYEIGIVPVVVIEDENDAKALAKALVSGGLNCAEVTFRTKAAPKAIKIMTEEYPDMLVGAGTVLTTEQVDMAVEAGAKFIVSPGSNSKVITYCQKIGIPIIPGIMTPSEIEANLELGLDVMKFFPAESAGGLNFLKAVSAPYGQVRFMPTGGINQNNVTEYLKFNKIVACGGSFMATKDMIANKEFDKIEALTREAADLVKTVR